MEERKGKSFPNFSQLFPIGCHVPNLFYSLGKLGFIASTHLKMFAIFRQFLPILFCRKVLNIVTFCNQKVSNPLSLAIAPLNERKFPFVQPTGISIGYPCSNLCGGLSKVGQRYEVPSRYPIYEVISNYPIGLSISFTPLVY